MFNRLQFKLQSPLVRKVLSNTTWLMSERLLRMFVGLFVGVLIARQLGPELYGELSYALSMLMLFTMVTHLGLDGMTVREQVARPEDKERILGTVLKLKFIASLFGAGAMLIFAWFTAELGSPLFWLLVLFSVSILWSSKIVLEFYNEANIKGKYSANSKSFALLLSGVFKLILIFHGASVLWFGVAVVLESMLLLIALVFCFRFICKEHWSCWHYDSSLAKSMLSGGWMVMVGTIFATTYRKIDQAMLMWLTDSSEVGIYAVAVTLSEVWHFVPMTIVASVYPVLITLKGKSESTYQQKLQNIFDLLAIFSIALAIGTTFVAYPLISFLYGVAYIESAPILIIHIWSCVFVFARALFSRWIHIEKVFLFSMVTQGAGAVVNILLNLWLIPNYGGQGAAIATIVSYGAATFGLLLFHHKTRDIFWLMLKSFMVMFRIKSAFQGMFKTASQSDYRQS